MALRPSTTRATPTRVIKLYGDRDSFAADRARRLAVGWYVADVRRFPLPPARLGQVTLCEPGRVAYRVAYEALPDPAER
jgi:hypothetical protein